MEIKSQVEVIEYRTESYSNDLKIMIVISYNEA